jgi:hypothetical protein
LDASFSRNLSLIFSRGDGIFCFCDFLIVIVFDLCALGEVFAPRQLELEFFVAFLRGG